MPNPPSDDDQPLRLAVELMTAHLAITGTRRDRLALHHDLRELAAAHPTLDAAMRSLIEERTKSERWRTYNRAEKAAAEWAERNNRI